MYDPGTVSLKNGTRLGPYEILSPLGRGGMGEVYRARDTRLGRTVAIKILPEEFLRDPKRKSRFEREARAISALNHPNVCALYDVSDSFLVMEYCEGSTLADRIASGPLSAEDTLRYGVQIADALETAHRQRIVHRDLKPSNVMVTARGVKLLDFGLAKQDLAPSDTQTTAEALTEHGAIVGTVPYMAPEVLLGRAADAKSDLFAFGAILYEMFSGKRAFGGASSPEVIAAILKQEPESLTEIDPKTPPALDRLVRACLAKDPEKRLGTAEEALGELRAIAAGTEGTLAPPRTARRSQRASRLRVAGIAAAALVAVAAGSWAWRRQAATSPSIRSLAVLPFENVSKPEDAYLVAGMQDGVIGELSQVSSLRLISRTSTMRYDGTKETMPEIARDLHVDGLVEGSLSRSGEDLEVRVRLVRAGQDERQVWSKSYRRGIAGVLALQTDVARGVALATRSPLTAEEKARLSREPKAATENYGTYLKGMYYVRTMTPEGAKRGIGYLEDVVARDPSDPLAHAGLALAYTILGHGPSPPPDVAVRARAEAERAIELDDTIADAHAALGAIAMFLDWDWPTAKRELRRALQLNPNLAEAHRDYAWYLDLPGPNPASIVEMKRARELDPLNALYAGDLSWLYYRAGRRDDAVREARDAVALDPKGPLEKFALAVTCSEAGLHEEAIAAGERAAAISPAWKFALAFAYAKAGRRADALRLANEAEQTIAPVSTWGLAYVYATLDDEDGALQWLEKGVASRFGFLLWMKGTPAFTSLRGNPRFEALIRSFQLPEPEPAPAAAEPPGS